METPHISVDDSLWPLLVLRFTGTPTDEEFEAYMRKRGSYLVRGEKHVLIYDTASFRVLTGDQRQRQIDWLKANAPLLRQWSLGSALVIVSPAVRLLLSVVLHFAQSSTPYHAARSIGEAAAWAAGRLADAGLLAEAQRVRQHFGLTRKNVG